MFYGLSAMAHMGTESCNRISSSISFCTLFLEWHGILMVIFSWNKIIFSYQKQFVRRHPRIFSENVARYLQNIVAKQDVFKEFEMRYGALAILVAMMLFATTIRAESLEVRHINFDDTAIYVLEGTMSHSKFTSPPFKSFSSDLWCFKLPKCFSRMEYGVEIESYFPGQGKTRQKQAIVTRFQLFNKPIYLTFTFTE